tara:strand:+ start:508 stop:744 length:237 start_codon:yes stop_codon:yes gene_type:complete
MDNPNDKKQKIQDYNAMYYQKNKDKIIKRLTEKVTCTCGRKVGKNSLKNHLKTNIHAKYLALKVKEETKEENTEENIV